MAGDGETLEILLQNALRYLRGEPPVRGLLAVQEAFCRRQAAYAASPACADDAAYWQEVLTPPVPTVNQAAGAASRKGAMIGVNLDAETAQGFEILAKNSGASVLACFVALAGRALCRRFERKELLLGVPMSLLSQLSKSLSVAVGIEDVMGYPSPRALAVHIGSLAKADVIIPRVEGLAVYPLSPAQQRIWFLQKLHEKLARPCGQR